MIDIGAIRANDDAPRDVDEALIAAKKLCEAIREHARDKLLAIEECSRG